MVIVSDQQKVEFCTQKLGFKKKADPDIEKYG